MRDLYRIKPLKTLAWWIVTSLFVWPLALMALATVGIPYAYIVSSLQDNFNLNYDFYWIFGAIATPFAGAIIGAVIAFLQRRILRNNLYWTADKWYRWTMIGGAVAASLVGIAVLVSADSIYNNGPPLFMMPIFLAVVSSFQFIALRHAVKQAWLWIIANIVGGIVFAAVPLNNQVDYYNSNSEFTSLGIGILAVVSLGFITGFVLLFLFEKKLLPMRPESDEDNPKEPKSVWDRAI